MQVYSLADNFLPSSFNRQYQSKDVGQGGADRATHRMNFVWFTRNDQFKLLHNVFYVISHATCDSDILVFFFFELELEKLFKTLTNFYQMLMLKYI